MFSFFNGPAIGILKSELTIDGLVDSLEILCLQLAIQEFILFEPLELATGLASLFLQELFDQRIWTGLPRFWGPRFIWRSSFFWELEVIGAKELFIKGINLISVLIEELAPLGLLLLLVLPWLALLDRNLDWMEEVAPPGWLLFIVITFRYSPRMGLVQSSPIWQNALILKPNCYIILLGVGRLGLGLFVFAVEFKVAVGLGVRIRILGVGDRLFKVRPCAAHLFMFEYIIWLIEISGSSPLIALTRMINTARTLLVMGHASLALSIQKWAISLKRKKKCILILKPSIVDDS